MANTRQDGSDWDSAYSGDDPPPWDIGRPQPVFAALAPAGLLRGRLLDAGCGTGEHTLLAAAAGATAYGVDLSQRAISTARSKASVRGLSVVFEAGDVLTVSLPGAPYDTILDSGVFHVFDDADRSRYVSVLTQVAAPSAMLYLACFSDRQPGDWGPRRVTEGELRAAFGPESGWVVEDIEPATFEINPMPEADRVEAWFATFRRTAE